MSAGFAHIVALLGTSQNIEGKVTSFDPTAVPTETRGQTIAAGGEHSLALLGNLPSTP
ncbi:hypothetical protein ACFYVL_42770 [Streptomyces sp. NPDC004111]|uniref:hypothetical protein n=1 Tax=Streptomyces sp. NPDC004111 TaxID=3364690 RepID=UPI003683AE96